MTTRWRVFWSLAALLVMAIIFYFSSQSSGTSEDLSDAFAGILKMEQVKETTRVSNQGILFGLTLRKLAHIVLFAALGFCLCNAFTGVRGNLPWAAGLSYLYAVFDEVHQTLSGRFGRWQDTLIDLIGIAIGIIAHLLLLKLWQVLTEKYAKRSQ